VAAGRIPVLRQRFEDMLAYPAKVIHDIAHFLGLPRPENPPLPDAKRAHERSPIRSPTEGIDAWRSPIGIDVWAHTGNLPGATARAVGYLRQELQTKNRGDAPRSFADAIIERDEKTTLQN
jgi:hypothetical protein